MLCDTLRGVAGAGTGIGMGAGTKAGAGTGTGAMQAPLGFDVGMQGIPCKRAGTRARAVLAATMLLSLPIDLIFVSC